MFNELELHPFCTVQRIHPLILWAMVDLKNTKPWKRSNTGPNENVLSVFIFSPTCCCNVLPLESQQTVMSAAAVREKEETRDLWSDANIAGSPNANRYSRSAFGDICDLMQTMSWPAVRALKSTLRQLATSHTAVYSTVDVL